MAIDRDLAAANGRSSWYDAFLQASLDLLVCAEYALYELIAAAGYWPPDTPAPPEPAGTPTPDSLEYGVFLFLICHPERIADRDVRIGAVAYAVAVTELLGHPPKSHLTPALYAALDGWNLVAPDGSIAGTAPFELYDQNWLYALFNLGRCLLHGNVVNGGRLPLPGPGYRPTRLDRGAGTECTVGLLSDWGTGTRAAIAVMDALAALSPDAIVHLGDVYYSGTPAAPNPYHAPGEEQRHLLDPWPKRPNRPCFTLNSNHEMYSGGQGLFTVALADPIFAHQQGLSVFVATVADWTILGLDSAFNAALDTLYMNGRLDPPGTIAPTTAPTGTQAAWVRSLRLDPARTIVLTHHNGFDPNCDPTVDGHYRAFRQQLVDALGGMPHAWFWGHVHNAIVYDRPAPGGTAIGTLCRCIGNGALPYGVSPSLSSPHIVWQAANTGSVDGLLRNGFATLGFTVGATGTVERITERYYTTADPAPAHTGVLFPRP